MSSATPAYSYADSIKSDASDELINTYALRPAAGLIVRMLYPTNVTPNQVTIAGIVAGCIAAGIYLGGTPWSTAVAGLCMTLKDLFDSADGQLARAKQMYSRAGRFLDSIGDIAVNFLAFVAFGYALWIRTDNPAYLAFSVCGFACTTLRVSYHVFYQTSFLHTRNQYVSNRTTEEILEEDQFADPTTLQLQKIFQFLYGWQDRLMAWIDWWSAGGVSTSDDWRKAWYGNLTGLRLSGLLGLGTELFLLMLFSVMNMLPEYLYVNLVGMNLLWVSCIGYRRMVVRRRAVKNVTKL